MTPTTRPSLQRRMLWITGGAAAAFLLTLLLAVLLFRDRTPPLTADALRAARAHWETAGPRSYRMELKKLGNRTDAVTIEVRDGRAVAFTLNGRTPEPRVWSYWTVPGMFETLEQELDGAEDPPQGFGARDGARATLRAEFDPAYGFPRYYFREVEGERLSVGWRVEQFEAH